MKKISLMSLIILSAFFSGWAQADTFNVSNAVDFQNALNTAAGNSVDDTINLSAGTYNSATQGDCFNYQSNQQNSLSVQGAGDQTILTGSETTPVLCFQTASGQDNGVQLSLSQMTVQDGSSVDPGAGARFSVHAASVSVQNVIFQNNNYTDFSDQGGALSIRTKTAGSSSLATTLTVQNCSFENNVAAGGAGGMIISYAEDAVTMNVSDNIFNNNVALTDAAGGAILMIGPGGKLTVDSNTFEGNEVQESGLGGGLGIQSPGGNITLSNNWVSGNTAKGAGGIVLFSIGTTSLIVNNVIVDNVSNGSIEDSNLGGGGLVVFQQGEGNNISIINNTITGNQATQTSGGGLALVLTQVESSENLIANNIIYGNTSVVTEGQDVLIAVENNEASDTRVDLIANDYLSFISSCTDCIDLNVATSNMNANPLFVDASADNYHLQGESPCLDTGDNAVPGYPSVDYDGTDRTGLADMGAFVGTAISPGTLSGDGCSLAKNETSNTPWMSLILFIPIFLKAFIKKRSYTSVQEGL